MELYPEKVLQVLKKFAFHESEETKEDLKQSIYLALLEAGERVNSPAIAYLIARDTVIKSLYYDKSPATLSMTEPAVANAAENQLVATPEYFLDRENIYAAMKVLEDDEVNVIFRRFIMLETRKTICKELDMTVGKIRELEKSGMRKMKESLKVEEK